MIEIDNIEKPCRYKFPTIDFKFQNSGNLTAFLTEFIILIEASIDTSPELEFTFWVHSKENETLLFDERKKHELNASVELSFVTFKCSNKGWGPALDCEIVPKVYSEIDNTDILTNVFPPDKLIFRGKIDSGASMDIISLNSSDMNKDKFYNILNNALKKYRHKLQGNKQNLGFHTRRIRLECRYRDTKGNFTNRTLYLRGRKALYVNAHAFRQTNLIGTLASMGRSDTTYCVIIDPADNYIERSYKVSRKISPGGIDRFHVMIGATKSCFLRTKFQFKMNKSDMVESNVFNIEIWNPMNSHLYGKYKDGEAIDRNIEDLARQMKQLKSQMGSDSSNLTSLKIMSLEKELEVLSRSKDIYPFINPKNK